MILINPTTSIAKARPTPAKGNSEPEVSAGVEDDSEDGDVAKIDANGMPYVIETALVMPTGSDFTVPTAAKSCRTHSLLADRRSSADLASANSADLAATEAAVCAGRVSTQGIDKAVDWPSP